LSHIHITGTKNVEMLYKKTTIKLVKIANETISVRQCLLVAQKYQNKSVSSHRDIDI